MFGSRREPELMDGRRIIWRSNSQGVPFQDVYVQLAALAGKYEGKWEDLRFGYWEYGDEIVITAPDPTPNT